MEIGVLQAETNVYGPCEVANPIAKPTPWVADLGLNET